MGRRPFDAVIFDQDGTLFQSDLDFNRVREEINLEGEIDIIGFLNSRPPEIRKAGYNILCRHEMRAAKTGRLFPGVEILMEYLMRSSLQTALLTRNHRAATRLVMTRFPCLQFHAIRTRDEIPVKPDPESIYEICRTLKVSPRRTLMVGDYLHDLDVAAEAGAVSVLFVENELPEYAETADFIIDDMISLRGLLRI